MKHPYIRIAAAALKAEAPFEGGAFIRARGTQTVSPAPRAGVAPGPQQYLPGDNRIPDFLHRVQDRFVRSGNAPDFPAVDWIGNPVLNGLPFRDAGTDVRYTLRNTFPDDTVTEMSQAQKNAVDAANLEAQRDNAVAQLDRVEDILRALVLIFADELNAHADRINAILNAIDSGSNLAQVKANIAAITDYPQRDISQLRTAIRNRLGT